MAVGDLSEQQIVTINAALRTLHDLVGIIPKLAACGTDCSDYMRKIEELTQKLTAFKVNFGGGK